MGKVLDELLDLHCWSLDKTKAENRDHIASLKSAIVEAVEGLIPVPQAPNRPKLPHTSAWQVGYNAATTDFLQAIKEWQ